MQTFCKWFWSDNYQNAICYLDIVQLHKAFIILRAKCSQVFVKNGVKIAAFKYSWLFEENSEYSEMYQQNTIAMETPKNNLNFSFWIISDTEPISFMGFNHTFWIYKIIFYGIIQFWLAFINFHFVHNTEDTQY